MRTITLLTIAVIMTALLSYYFMGEDTGPKQLQALTSQVGATSDWKVQDELDKLASVLQRYQETNQEQWQQAQLQQARLHKMLVDLDSRLRSVETAGGELTTNTAVSNNIEQATDTSVSNSGAEKSESEKVSESELGHWMDETLRVGYFDRDSTKLATEQTVKSLEKLPGVYLEDMQCAESFCRATFFHESGEQPDIANLFGEPPFVNEAFTIEEPDGRVTLYFTQPGESIEEFRNEAREAAQAELGW